MNQSRMTLCLPRFLIRLRRTVEKHILSARFLAMEDMTGSMSSTPWKNEESNQESKHGRILLQDPPDHPIALNAPGSG